ncbi:hypothetical protein ACHAXA_008290 [Cyclostephanos tholiformis]|uniref:IBR domain-containing protein n=1 Tax=Cyclostephanos tholiformis TaxID=382380 RepID=A0ABD3R6A0_9STRA
MSSFLRQDPTQHGVDGVLLPSQPDDHYPKPEKASTCASSTPYDGPLPPLPPPVEKPSSSATSIVWSKRDETNDGKRKKRGLPPGVVCYYATIFTTELGIMFLKPRELVDTLFLQTEKGLVDTLDERPVVAFIHEGSSARSVGVELGHVLLKVNCNDVKNPEEANRLIKEGPRSLRLLFYVPERGMGGRTISPDVASSCVGGGSGRMMAEVGSRRSNLMSIAQIEAPHNHDELQFMMVAISTNMTDLSKCTKCGSIAFRDDTLTSLMINWVQCPQCLFKSCVECGEEYHPDKRCNQVESKNEIDGRIQVEEAMTSALVRTCPLKVVNAGKRAASAVLKNGTVVDVEPLLKDPPPVCR